MTASAESRAYWSSVYRVVAAHGEKPQQAYPALSRPIAGAHWKGCLAAHIAVTIFRRCSRPQWTVVRMSGVPSRDAAHDQLPPKIGPARAGGDSMACSELCRRRCATTSRSRTERAGNPRLSPRSRIIPGSDLPQTSNNIIQKGLAFVRERSGSVTVPGARRPRDPAPPAASLPHLGPAVSCIEGFCNASEARCLTSTILMASQKPAR